MLFKIDRPSRLRRKWYNFQRWMDNLTFRKKYRFLRPIWDKVRPNEFTKMYDDVGKLPDDLRNIWWWAHDQTGRPQVWPQEVIARLIAHSDAQVATMDDSEFKYPPGKGQEHFRKVFATYHGYEPKAVETEVTAEFIYNLYHQARSQMYDELLSAATKGGLRVVQS